MNQAQAQSLVDDISSAFGSGKKQSGLSPQDAQRLTNDVSQTFVNGQLSPRATNQIKTLPQIIPGTINAKSNNPQLPQDQTRRLIQKYFPQDQWDNAYKVMQAESGGRADAKGDDYVINGVYAPSYGLFQIRGLPGRPNGDQLINPELNVRYAADMYKNQGWQPWSTARKMGLPGTTPLPE